MRSSGERTHVYIYASVESTRGASLTLAPMRFKLGECNALWGEREQSRFMFVCTLLYTLLNNPPAHMHSEGVIQLDSVSQ